MVYDINPGRDTPKPRTLTMVGDFEGSIVEVTKNFKPGFIDLVSESEESENLGIYVPKRPSYLALVSGSLIGPITQLGAPFEVMLTVTSEFAKRNREIANEFERQTGIRLRKASQHLEKYMQELTEVFEKCRKDESRAMDIVRTIPTR